jgi:hypothetical protein
MRLTPGSSEVEHGVRGGAFDDRAAALTCQVESDEESEPSGLPNLGIPMQRRRALICRQITRQR